MPNLSGAACPCRTLKEKHGREGSSEGASESVLVDAMRRRLQS